METKNTKIVWIGLTFFLLVGCGLKIPSGGGGQISFDSLEWVGSCKGPSLSDGKERCYDFYMDPDKIKANLALGITKEDMSLCTTAIFSEVEKCQVRDANVKGRCDQKIDYDGILPNGQFAPLPSGTRWREIWWAYDGVNLGTEAQDCNNLNQSPGPYYYKATWTAF